MFDTVISSTTLFWSLCWCTSKGPINRGGWFVALFSNLKFLYVVTVRLILSSNMLSVGSVQNIENSWGLAQNWTNSSNWWSDARTTRKSGYTLHYLIKMVDFAMLSSLFVFWSNIHIASLLFSLALPWLLKRWESERVTFFAACRALYKSDGPLGSLFILLTFMTSPEER